MAQKNIAQTKLLDYKVNVRIKLSSLWATLMALYIYADYFQLMTPGTIEGMQSLESPVGPITPTLLVIFSVILIIPALMIFLSLSLPPAFAKWLNILFALSYAAISVLIIVADIGNAWQASFVLYNFIELFVMITAFIMALKWPRE